MGKGEKVKMCFSFTFHWPLSLEHSIDHQTLEHSIGHQTLKTFHWPPSFGYSFTFHLLLFKGRFRTLGALSFPRHNFQLKS
jgi:hypothetical protein